MADREEQGQEDELPEIEHGRRFFPTAWTRAANEGLISDDELIEELTRHSRAENRRTIPGIPWRDDEDDRPPPLSSSP